ncbi:MULTISPECIES: urease accessory protein UreH domain-containing protein [Bacillaceae]|uniref:urease accessory protein UreH domain-containing protein n=1 Tax=Bacillaceae TaxID=186817 RepID=UPI00031732E6|nr:MULTISPECIES: sulfite exporter TauE/SafE family protein [Bacillaceae]
MYEFFSKISYMLSQPFYNMVNTTEGIPILFAFVLGIVGALTPCQFTGNLGAITLYGNKSVQKQIAWKEIIFFILGKIFVFTILGITVWMLGNEFKSILALYFPWFRKVVGPILILIGLFMLDVIRFYKSFVLGSIPEKFIKKGNFGAFLMGVSFTLGFCPTMFVLFFVTLMPATISVSYGVILPAIFAIGTSLPLLITLFLIWYFELSGKLVKKKGRKIGVIVQKLAGITLLILGVLDTLTYW